MKGVISPPVYCPFITIAPSLGPPFFTFTFFSIFSLSFDWGHVQPCVPSSYAIVRHDAGDTGFEEIETVIYYGDIYVYDLY